MEKCDKFKHILKEEEDTSRSYSKQVTNENYSKFCKDLKTKTTREVIHSLLERCIIKS